MIAWYSAPGTPPVGTWWWAVEHIGHPAFYLRALLPGDFGPGRRPAQRHLLTLRGVQPVSDSVTCGTCGGYPLAEHLEPVERATGDRGFLESFRNGSRPWPAPTDPGSCWRCSGPSPLGKFCGACAPRGEA